MSPGAWIFGCLAIVCSLVSATACNALQSYEVDEVSARAIAAGWLMAPAEDLNYEGLERFGWRSEEYTFAMISGDGAHRKVRISARSGAVVGFYDVAMAVLANQAKNAAQPPEFISPEAAEAAATAYLSARGWDPALDQLSLIEKSAEAVLWRQLLPNGGIHGSRFVSVTLNPLTAEVLGFSRVVLPYLNASLTPTLTQEQALAVAVQAASQYYPGRYFFPKPSLPPNLWYSDLGQPLLYYAHTLAVSLTPAVNYDAAMEGGDSAEVDVVIDAHSGSVLSFDPSLSAPGGKPRPGKARVKWRGRWVELGQLRRAPGGGTRQWSDPWLRNLEMDGHRISAASVGICMTEGVSYLQARELGSPRWKGQLEGRGDQLQIRMLDGASGRIALGSRDLLLGRGRRIRLTGPALKRGNRWYLPLEAWQHFTRDTVEWRPKDSTLVIQCRRE